MKMPIKAKNAKLNSSAHVLSGSNQIVVDIWLCAVGAHDSVIVSHRIDNQQFNVREIDGERERERDIREINFN